ncbi:MAG: hypothetical protein AAGG08_19045, partial [Actinomycetota bacterium]
MARAGRLRERRAVGPIRRTMALAAAGAVLVAGCVADSDDADDESDTSSDSSSATDDDASENSVTDPGDTTATDDPTDGAADTDEGGDSSDASDADADAAADDESDVAEEPADVDQDVDQDVEADVEADVERTASFRGVTEDTIRVGVIDYDWDGLADIGVDFGVTNSVDLFAAALESINDRGGIAGRQLELFQREFLPVGDGAANQVCVELAEDEEVFMVVGRLRDDQVLCFTEQYETAAFAPLGM